ncbi:papilin-like [Amphibalanus amphitrite]|uniref:papilin-like n=1 Tax=Amphibalanus amphitrite TaxID=1232801 RepID=UPI001C91A2A0|nr:papilin-like [Amphibalanus amphitrite]
MSRLGVSVTCLSCVLHVAVFSTLLAAAVSLHPPELPAAEGTLRARSATEPPQAACRLPRDRGWRCSPGPTLRWYLDEEQADCVSFWYSGCGGNSNNFPTERACREVCVEPDGPAVCLLPAGRGPCTDSQLLWTYDAETGQCVTFVYGGCYGTANRFFTRRQCERSCVTDHDSADGDSGADPDCLQQAGVSGQCGAELVRYTYLAAADVCTPFLYGGCAGNGNNFDTLEECRERCGTLTDDQSKTKENSTETAFTREATSNSSDKVTAPPVDASICFLPRDSGSCLSYAPMFYYDVRTASCHQFIYRGCGGNANRFHTSAECRQRCVDAGDGTVGGSETSDLESVDEQVVSGQAQMNITGGESSTISSQVQDGGVENETNETKRNEASSVAPTTNPSTTPALVSGKGNLTSPAISRAPHHRRSRPVPLHRPPGRRRRLRGRRACLLRPRPGPCQHYLPQFYYYNADLAACFAFIYGGCGGNRNRFVTKEACESHCRGVRRLGSHGERVLDGGGTRGERDRDGTRRPVPERGGVRGTRGEKDDPGRSVADSGRTQGKRYGPWRPVLDRGGLPLREGTREEKDDPRRPVADRGGTRGETDGPRRPVSAEGGA